MPKNSVGTIQLQKNAVTGAKVKNRSLGAADFKAGQLIAGRQGPRGEQGVQGSQGIQGVPGTARAYGRVAADGSLTRSKNALGVTRPYSNVYCIELAADIDASQTGLVATPDFTGGSTSFTNNGKQTILEWRSDAPNCPAGRMEVFTGVRQVITAGSADGGVHAVANGYQAEPFFFVVP